MRSADRHSMSQHRLAAWRGRTEHRTPNTKDMDSRLRGNDEARVRVNDGKVVAVAGCCAPATDS